MRGAMQGKKKVSGMRGEGGGVVPRGAGASGALVIIQFLVILF